MKYIGKLLLEVKEAAELLANFAMEGLHGRLAFIDFAAGKLPKARETPSLRSLGEQNSAFMSDDGADDAHDGGG